MRTVKLQLKNKYRAVLIDTTTNSVKSDVTFHNVVLDSWFNRLNQTAFPGYVNQLMVGTGTGTPSRVDTQLFHYIDSVTARSNQPVAVDEDYVFAWQWDFKFTENQAIGSLTEMGLRGSNNILLTHALITDSEDSPIVIEKTDTDVLLVTAVVYASLKTEGPFLPIIYYNSSEVNDWLKLTSKNPFPERAPENSSLTRYARWLLGVQNDNSPSSTAFYGVTTYPIIMRESSQDESGCVFCSGTQTQVEGWTRYSSNRILAEEDNGAATYLIKFLGVSVDSPCCPAMWAPLPNHDIFPPKQLEFQLLGDGATTDFNLGVPELMQENVTVTIDGTVAAATEYEFSGKDYNCSQAWISQDNRFLDYDASEMELGSYEYYNNTPWLIPQSVFVTSSVNRNTYTKFRFKKLVYDFGNEVPVSEFTTRAPGTSNQIGHNLNGRTIYLFYSTDGEIWLTAASVACEDSYARWDVQFPTIQARYWKIECADGNWIQGSSSSAMVGSYGRLGSADWMFCAFGHPQPQLKFNTAPVDGAVIKVQANCEYPIKNSNWLIDSLIVDCKWERDLT